MRRRQAARRRAVFLLSWILAPLAALSIAALVVMWPDAGSAPSQVGNPYAAAPGASIDSGVVQCTATEDCSTSAGGTAGTAGTSCFIAYTEVKGAGEVPVVVSPDIVQPRGVKAGDTIRYLNLSGLAAVTGAEHSGSEYVFMDFVRTLPMGLLAALYALVVVAVARWRGLRAMVCLGGAFGVLAWFILPALAQGQPPLMVALVGSSAIMFDVLYFAHGFSVRTSTALLGTLFGLGVTARLAAWAVDAAALTGTSGHNAYQLMSLTNCMSLSGMILCALVISGLGVLNESDHHPVLGGVGASRNGLAHHCQGAVRLGHADWPRPYRLHRLHHRVCLRRKRAAGAVDGLALRPTAAESTPSAEMRHREPARNQVPDRL